LTPWARTGADDGKSAKRQAAGSEKFLMKGIQVLTKLALKNAMDVRELQAASLMTVQLPKDNPMIQGMLTATRAFNDEQEKAKSSNTSPPEGQPHCHAWIALLEELNKNASEQDKEILQQHVLQSCGNPSLVACCVHVCRVKKCFDQSKMKICIAASESVKPVLQVFESHDSHVRNQGGKTLHGQAPKGGLERDAQTFLDQLPDMLK
jgi:hypothetical protein